MYKYWIALQYGQNDDGKSIKMDWFIMWLSHEVACHEQPQWITSCQILCTYFQANQQLFLYVLDMLANKKNV